MNAIMLMNIIEIAALVAGIALVVMDDRKTRKE